MRRTLAFHLSVVFLLLVSACSFPKSGNYHTTGLVNESKEANMITVDDGSNSKTGTACTKNYAGFYINGDSSIEAAVKNGGLTKVNYVDKKIFSIGTLYAEVCTVVRGH